jgi:FkbM family methyltransferase
VKPSLALARFRPRKAHRFGRRKARRFYRQFVPQGGLCFDVGANMGERTEVFVDLGARVVAVEPQPDCAETLRRRFKAGVEVVEGALGAQSGEAELLVANYHTLASLSREWVEAVQASGRFSAYSWDRSIVVPVLTLEELIARVGEPDFCKIDVEGFELEVSRGLGRPLAALSVEFDFERAASRIAAVEHLARLGMTRFNFSYGESMELALSDWVGSAEIIAFLEAVPKRIEVFGDVYSRRELSRTIGKRPG